MKSGVLELFSADALLIEVSISFRKSLILPSECVSGLTVAIPLPLLRARPAPARLSEGSWLASVAWKPLWFLAQFVLAKKSSIIAPISGLAGINTNYR